LRQAGVCSENSWLISLVCKPRAKTSPNHSPVLDHGDVTPHELFPPASNPFRPRIKETVAEVFEGHLGKNPVPMAATLP
jgi:hypothetical protein